MSAPKARYSSLALPMRETCASVTPSVTVLRTNTTLDCSRVNGTNRCKHSRMQKVNPSLFVLWCFIYRLSKYFSMEMHVSPLFLHSFSTSSLPLHGQIAMVYYTFLRQSELSFFGIRIGEQSGSSLVCSCCKSHIRA